jgi:hypothetical protein
VDGVTPGAIKFGDFVEKNLVWVKVITMILGFIEFALGICLSIMAFNLTDYEHLNNKLYGFSQTFMYSILVVLLIQI